VHCGLPKYCKISAGSLVEFVSVPSGYLKHLNLPMPVAHIYYHSRKSDIDDGVVKISGHYKSQTAIQWAVLSSLVKQFVS
jgi:hypothetical protein